MSGIGPPRDGASLSWVSVLVSSNGGLKEDLVKSWLYSLRLQTVVSCDSIRLCDW